MSIDTRLTGAHVGFTGSRYGLTKRQFHNLDGLVFWRIRDCTFHHGVCIGADKQAHDIAKILGFTVEGHPPIERRWRATCDCDVLHEPKNYLERNHDIVDATEILIACPRGPEELRSGTWSTVRYARKKGRQVVILWP